MVLIHYVDYRQAATFRLASDYGRVKATLEAVERANEVSALRSAMAGKDRTIAGKDATIGALQDQRDGLLDRVDSQAKTIKRTGRKVTIGVIGAAVAGFWLGRQ